MDFIPTLKLLLSVSQLLLTAKATVPAAAGAIPAPKAPGTAVADYSTVLV